MSTSTAQTSSCSRELELVGKVEMRIALANTDEKLESLLGKYLAPLLLKLGSEHLAVRNKVISICQHINTRITPTTIKLPVLALLKQYKETKKPLIRHFDLIYVQQAVGRLPKAERVTLFPSLIDGISSAPDASVMFSIALGILPILVFPERGTPEDAALRENLGLAASTKDASFLSFWFQKFILLPHYSRTTINESSITCPGVSSAEYDFLDPLDKPSVWKLIADGAYGIVDVKVAIINFLASGAFLDSERFIPLLSASADVDSRISDLADTALKRFTPETENLETLQKLFQLYLGDVNNGVPGAPTRVKMKILAILSKSIKATHLLPEIQKVIVDGMMFSGPSLKGSSLEGSKFNGQLMAFINWVARISSPANLSKIAPDIIERLQFFLDFQGWPVPMHELSAMDMDLRGKAYVSLGLLAQSHPNLTVDPDLPLLRWFFASLSCDQSGAEISVSIDQALGSVLNSFSKGSSKEVQNNLKEMLYTWMNLKPNQKNENGFVIVRSAEYAAVRFANRSLPYGDVVARTIDLLAAGASVKQRHELVEEGQKGLNPYWYQMMNPKESQLQDHDWYAFPDFIEMIKQVVSCFCFNQDSQSRILQIEQSKVNSFAAAVAYSRNLLLWQLISGTTLQLTADKDWERQLDVLLETSEDARILARNGLRTLDKTALESYLSASLSGMLWSHEEGLGSCAKSFIEACTFCPGHIVDEFAPFANGLCTAIYSNNSSVRYEAAHAFGLLATSSAYPESQRNSDLGRYIAKVKSWNEAVGSDMNQVHGAILAIAFLLSRLSYRGRLDAVAETLTSSIIENLVDAFIQTKDKSLISTISLAISQLSISGVLVATSIRSPDALLDKLNALAEEANEKAILAMGHLALVYHRDQMQDINANIIIDKLYALHTIRTAETHFAIGEALTVSAAGWESKSLITAFDVEGPLPKTVSPDGILEKLLQRLFRDCRTTQPRLKKASSIWLLCLVQYCGHLKPVQDHLSECQVTFMSLLGARDELVQETGARGLTLVYERMENSSMKDCLVRDLVGAFTGSANALSGAVSEETRLFEPGALPTGDGSVTTYKDIVSLAAEVGDPSLVYRFMALASNNAIWSSRAAFGRFGLSSILADSNVDGYLSHNTKLYPKLYRYRFDPNPNVQRSMNEIWSALVKNSSVTVDQHFDSIMEDLLHTILGKEWRVRQASCAALADLISGKPLEKYQQYMDQIWSASFKVLDDIKESVRVAAVMLVQSLTATVVRSLESGDISADRSRKMLQHVVPFLLSPSGIEASAKEVQAFAIHTILEIVRKASPGALRPFIPGIVEKLLALLSGLESQAVNYVRLNSDKYGVTGDEIDKMRLTNVRASPMMETIERCLDMLDELTIKLLSKALENVMRASIDLPSKVGCSRVLVSLCTRKTFLFRPYADGFLQLLQKFMIDRNSTVSASYAAAAGYLCRLATQPRLIKLGEFASKLYFDSEDEAHMIVSGSLIHSMSKFSPDRFKDMGECFLPLAFVAKHDPNKTVKEAFENAWDDSVGGSRAISLYLGEILKLCSTYSESRSWTIKHTCALAVANIIQKISTHMSMAEAETIWPVLEVALKGKSWEGKEIVLEAFVKFVQAKDDFWRKRPIIRDQMKKIIFMEARRQNVAYRQHALRCLGDFSEAFDLDLGHEIIDIVESVIETLCDPSTDAMETDDLRDGSIFNQKGPDMLITNALSTMYRSINVSQASQSDLVAQLDRALAITSNIFVHISWEAKLGLYDQFARLFTRILDGGKIIPESTISNIWSIILKEPSDNLPEHVRLKRSKALLELARLSRKSGDSSITTWASQVQNAQALERSTVVQKELKAVLAVLAENEGSRQ